MIAAAAASVVDIEPGGVGSLRDDIPGWVGGRSAGLTSTVVVDNESGWSIGVG